MGKNATSFGGPRGNERCLTSPGRPRSLRTQIEAHFGPNGQFAWEKLSRIMNGQEESTQERVLASGEIVEVRVRPTISEKQAAAELAIAYLEGRPTQTTVSASVEIAPDALDDNALRMRVAEILARYAAPALEPAREQVIEGELVPARALPDKT